MVSHLAGFLSQPPIDQPPILQFKSADPYESCRRRSASGGNGLADVVGARQGNSITPKLSGFRCRCGTCRRRWARRCGGRAGWAARRCSPPSPAPPPSRRVWRSGCLRSQSSACGWRPATRCCGRNGSRRRASGESREAFQALQAVPLQSSLRRIGGDD